MKAVSLFNGRLIFSLGISNLFGIALVLPGSLWLFYTNLVSLDDDWQGKPGMVVYLEPGISEVEIEVIKKRLALMTDVEEVSVISAEEGLELFGEATGIGGVQLARRGQGADLRTRSDPRRDAPPYLPANCIANRSTL